MLNLTEEEKTVLVFILACFIAGTGINFYKKVHKRDIIHPSSHDAFASVFVSTPKAPSAAEGERVNINTAGINQLIRLKGIGVKTAERIIAYRQENGPFFHKEGLMNVKGIGRGRFESIKEGITAE